MAGKWYYAADGKSIGPLSTAEVFQRIVSTKSGSHLVWTEGMPDWAEASARPEFLHAFAKESPVPATGDTPAKATLAQRARRELIEFLVISAYLYIYFGALIVYKATILLSVGVTFAPYGLALVKALISAKFIMLLEALKLGENGKRASPLIVILRKSSLFAVFLIVLTLIEELIVGSFHGKAVHEILGQIAGGSLAQALAVGLLIFLIMIPYFTYRELQPERMQAKT
jgi:GYF domain 2